MANNTLDKAMKPFPILGNVLNCLLKMGMAHVVVCLNIFFIASCALTISLFCLSPLTFDLKEPPRRSHWQAMVCVAYGQPEVRPLSKLKSYQK